MPYVDFWAHFYLENLVWIKFCRLCYSGDVLQFPFLAYKHLGQDILRCKNFETKLLLYSTFLIADIFYEFCCDGYQTAFFLVERIFRGNFLKTNNLCDVYWRVWNVFFGKFVIVSQIFFRRSYYLVILMIKIFVADRFLWLKFVFFPEARMIRFWVFCLCLLYKDS